MYKVSSFCNNSACIWVDCECEGAHPRKSSKSNPSGNSVRAEGCKVTGCKMVHVRDTNNPAPEAVLDYPLLTWAGGLSMIFQPVNPEAVPASYPANGRTLSLKVERGGVTLYFDEAERKAFNQGACLGEFVTSSIR